MKTKTQLEFITESIIIHGDKYNYDDVVYVNNKTKVKIYCNTCKDYFYTKPICHTRGNICKKCLHNNKRRSLDEFILNASKIHNNEYNYDNVVYKNNKTKIEIICKKHGSFLQRPDNHISGQKCPLCQPNLKSNTIDFINKSIKIHADKYDYSHTNYINAKYKLDIFCKKCNNTFSITPNDHLDGHGCSCNSHVKNNSKNVINIKKILDDNNIKYIREKTFDDCKLTKKLRFDYYLIDYNICIEYDGKQHYESIYFFGGIEKLKIIQLSDNIKTKYCKNNNIKLIRIRYDDDYFDILKKEFHINNE